MNWYSLRVISGKEEKIKESIFRELSLDNSISSDIEDIIVPMENVVEIKNGKKQIKKKVYFPGYIMMKMNMNQQSKFFIENINGVMSFVGPKGNPTSLSDDEVRRMTGVNDVDEESLLLADNIPFKVGDAVRVIDGPFKDFDGLVQEISDRSTIKVNVNIFGRPTPIELSVNQITSEN